jgi:hypothetical protein
VYLDAAGALNISGNAVISDNSANPALRITQTGAGNALLVEDAANPDASPFVIDTTGSVIVGYTQKIPTVNFAGLAVTPSFQELATTTSGSSQLNALWSTTSGAAPSIILAHSKSATIGTYSVGASGDDLGAIVFSGDDGTAFVPAASILSEIDGTPGAGDMPGRLTFSTTADGAATTTERMRINSLGEVGIGATTLTGISLRVQKALTGSVNTSGIRADGVVQSDSTTSAIGVYTLLGTAATAFTLTNLYQNRAEQGTLGVGSTVTQQYGYFAGATLIGATNNYGFYSNIASGTGRFNFYAQGTAANVFSGTTSIGGLVGSESLRVTPVASTVNYLNVSGGVTGSFPTLTAQGSDTNIGLTITAKGTSPILTQSNGFQIQNAAGVLQLLVVSTASAVNYLQATGAVTTGAPILSAQGSDANIDIALTPKGTGGVRFTGPLLPNNLAGTSGQVLTSAGAGAVPTWTNAGTGTVTSVAATAGTGISVSGSPITTSGTLTITNTAPDQTVSLTAGAGISTTGTYPNFTITNTGTTTTTNTFNASGTWTKPSTGSMARIQVWGGGGGAGRGTNTAAQSGGGGGGYNEVTLPLSSLAATETVTVGAAGVGRTASTGNGTAGGQSLFGSHCTAYGGGAGAGATSTRGGAGGGGQLGAGANAGDGTVAADPGSPILRVGGFAQGSGGALTAGGSGAFWHGGGSAAGDATAGLGGNSVFGGGAGSTGNVEGAGVSVQGGNGGARNTAGTAPAGGGGASSTGSGNGSNGAAGRIVVTVW